MAEMEKEEINRERSEKYLEMKKWRNGEMKKMKNGEKNRISELIFSHLSHLLRCCTGR